MEEMKLGVWKQKIVRYIGSFLSNSTLDLERKTGVLSGEIICFVGQ
jgi:hypothetical protein